jgi:hypothetical protein
MKKLIVLLAFVSSHAFGQMYSTTVGAPGSGYSGTVTASISANGSCSTPPTLGAVTLSGGGVSAVAVSYAGICPPAGAAPTISIAGSGTGASVTGIMVQGSIALLDSPLVASDQNQALTLTGGYRLYR